MNRSDSTPPPKPTMERVAPGIYRHTLRSLDRHGRPRESYSVIYYAEGKQRWKRLPTRKAAEAFRDKVRTQVREGTWETARSIPFGQVLDAWLRTIDARAREGDQMKRSTAAHYRHIVDKHLRPTLASVKTGHLTPVRVAAWRAEQAALLAEGKCSHASVQHAPHRAASRGELGPADRASPFPAAVHRRGSAGGSPPPS